jgi:hypothetical protein
VQETCLRAFEAWVRRRRPRKGSEGETDKTLRGNNQLNPVCATRDHKGHRLPTDSTWQRQALLVASLHLTPARFEPALAGYSTMMCMNRVVLLSSMTCTSRHPASA